ncbi:hypothetical protein KIN20_024624 [Parelaphostrongylus tenuis]|uniref:Uncharacterized protein n=1 Tax=Parelaphostrongylus tenuis TaxID=148309 RepID=A0AAD5MYH7_PARTN|nr:hypothetical protein KIN20_024624 [Parelaphostrongylus tenuis]
MGDGRVNDKPYASDISSPHRFNRLRVSTCLWIYKNVTMVNREVLETSFLYIFNYVPFPTIGADRRTLGNVVLIAANKVGAVPSQPPPRSIVLSHDRLHQRSIMANLTSTSLYTSSENITVSLITATKYEVIFQTRQAEDEV